MANVSIKFNGKEFLLSCDDGQEEHLEELLIQINQKFNELKNDLGNIGENKLLLITAVKLIKGKGRILVRKSGTEAKIRVMGESDNKALLYKCVKMITKKIK